MFSAIKLESKSVQYKTNNIKVHRSKHLHLELDIKIVIEQRQWEMDSYKSVHWVCTSDLCNAVRSVQLN